MGKMNEIGERMAEKPLIPLLAILVVTAASLGMIAYDPPSFDMEENSFAPDDDITRAAAVVSEAFSSSASVMVAVDALDTGGNIFTKDIFLDMLRYEKSLEDNLPYAKPENGFRIMSPIGIVASAITSEALHIADPSYDQMITVIGSPLVTNEGIENAALTIFTSPDGSAMLGMLTKDAEDAIASGYASARGSMISVVLLSSVVEDMEEGIVGFERSVKSMEFSLETDGLSLTVMDLNTMMAEIGDMASKDMSNLIPIALILIIIVLLLMYRDVVDTLIGLFGLMLAIVWTFGISTVLGIEMTTIAIAVPILLMGLGIDYGLHLVFRYREERTSGHDSAKASGETVNSVGEALVLATVTTVIAFLSYLTSSMSALADFGTMCAIGIVCAFVVMLLLIPAMQSLRDRRAERKGKTVEEIKRFRKSKSRHGDILGKAAGIGGRISAKSPWAVIGVTCIALLGFGYGATNLSYEFDMYSFIPEDTEASETLHYMEDNYSMTTETASVLIYADGWKLETLRAIEESISNLNENPVEGLEYNSESELMDLVYVNLVLTGAAMDPGAPSDYTIKYNAVFDGAAIRSSATQVDVDALRDAFFALSGVGMSDYIRAMSSVAGEYNGDAVTQIILNITPEAAEGGDAAIAARNGVDSALEPFNEAGIEALTTGSVVVMAVTLEEMNASQMSSLIMTLVLVLIILTIVMFFTDKSWLLGTMTTVPTLMSVVLVWGSMALMGIPLNVLTLTIASLTVGMGVTYGIHISHRYVTDIRDNGHDPRDAILTATKETGKGVLGAALTTAVGFGVIGFSSIAPMQQFGIITALAIAFGYIGATFLLPALLVVWGEHVNGRGKQSENRSE